MQAAAQPSHPGQAASADVDSVVERIRSFHGVTKGLKSGKPDSVTSGLVQEALVLLGSFIQCNDVVLASLKFLDEVLAAAPQAATLLRLEGGVKLLLKILRAYQAMDTSIVAVASRVLCKCATASQVTQQMLSKEKGIGSLFLSTCSTYPKDAAIVGPICDLMTMITKYTKGAQQLASDMTINVCKDLLVNYLGNWGLFGLALKVIKNIVKHEGPCSIMSRNSECVKLLLGVTRLLSRLPEQRKLLKRASRAIWLLNRHLLHPIPDLENAWQLPSKDSPHLNMLSAMDADLARHQELFPEEYGPNPPHLPCNNRPPTAVRLQRLPTALPPPALELSAAAQGAMDGSITEPFHAYGDTLEADMMMHDLRRVMHPDALINRPVYFNMEEGNTYDDTIGDEGAAPRPAGYSPMQGMGSGTLDLELLAALGIRDDPAASTTTRVPPPARLNSSSSSCSSTTTHDAKRSSHTGGLLSAGASVSAPRRTAGPSGTAPASQAARRSHTGGAGAAAGGSSGSSSNSHCHSSNGANSSSTTPPLAFESCFESGNLRAAVQIYENEYDLFLSSDLNDRSEGGNLVQWFYFGVSNVTPGIRYKFNLVNFRKKQSLFSCGKQPLVCMGRRPSTAREGAAPHAASSNSSSASEPEPTTSYNAAAGGQLGGGSSRILPGAAAAAAGAAADGRCWVRQGHNIAYYPSPYRGRPPNAALEGGSKKLKKTASTVKKGKAGGGKAAKDAACGTPDIGPGLYCCTFTLQFDAPGMYFVASCYPYSYSDLQEHLDSLTLRWPQQIPVLEQPFPPAAPTPVPGAGSSSNNSSNSSNSSNVVSPSPGPAPAVQMARSLLCYTLSGHRCDLLTITDFSSPAESIRQRECIMLTARVHPGETCASWIMQGILDFLTSDHPAASALRSSFIVKIVPMLNPDGVVNGSYRCSLAGCDLNRNWDKPNKWLHPTVYHTKKVLQQLAAAGRLALYIDIHGHSNKEDAFFYGCEPNLVGITSSAKDVRQTPAALAAARGASSAAAANANAGSELYDASLSGMPSQALTASAAAMAPAIAGSWQLPPGGVGPAAAAALDAGTRTTNINARTAARLRVRMLPFLASRLSQDFSMSKCNYRIRKCKLPAARVVVNRELGVAGSYTLEASLGGQSTSRTHFTLRDYMSLGRNLCKAIRELAEVDDASLLEDMAGKVVLPAYSSVVAL